MKPLTFWEKWRVFIFGLVGAIAISLQALFTETGEGEATRIYLYAGLMAALSFIATEWRGQGVSITGILGTLAGVFVTMQTDGTFTWAQFVVSAVLAVLAAVAPPPKPLTYEKNDAIVEAKTIPPIDQVVDNTKLPVGAIDLKKDVRK